MQVLKDSPLLKFGPNTLEEVRAEFNLNQDAIAKMLDNFNEWIAKQQHFTKKEFPHHYLETYIINAKGSLEKAKTNLDKLCTLKTLLPAFFVKHDVKNEFTDKSGIIIQATMPKLLKNNYRVYVVKIISSEIDAEMILDFNRFAILMSEYGKMNDYALGYTVVVDVRDINLMNLVTKVNIIDLRNSMSVLMEGYGFRINAIYVLSSSKTIDVFISLLKQVFSAKIASRIYIIKTVESLQEHLPKEFLPKDYGGEEKSLKEVNEQWVNVLSEEENVEFFKMMANARTDEKYRLTTKYNDQILGLPGSFRTLNVD